MSPEEQILAVSGVFGYTLDKLHTPYVTGQRISKASC